MSRFYKEHLFFEKVISRTLVIGYVNLQNFYLLPVKSLSGSKVLLSSELAASFVLWDRRSLSFFYFQAASFHLVPCSLCTKIGCLWWSQSTSECRSLSRCWSHFQLSFSNSFSLFFLLVLEQLLQSFLLVYLDVLVKVFNFLVTRKLLDLCIS